jgi:glycosyltransferase involved in cell wall biosynthesis
MKGNNIIYFGNDWFAENKTSSHHIAEMLSAGDRVLYVECPGLRMPRGNKRDLGKIFAKVKKSLAAPKKLSETFWVCTLFQIPLHRFALVRKLNRSLILFSVRRMLRKLGMTDHLAWFHIPHLSQVAGGLNSRGTVYYCIDSYSSLPNVDKKAIETMDDEMTRIADLVFVSSLPLYEKKRNIARNLLLSPHGVDFQHFSSGRSNALPVPTDVAALKGPVIGFWGLIEERIDLELISYLALKNPDWNIVMIGHVAVGENACAGLPNVHFVGPKKYQQLPEYAQIFDVAVLPYRMNDFVFNCNPIKLREYLATGKPVVSTYYPEVDKYRDVVSVAATHAEFEEGIAWYLEHDSPEAAARRVARVQPESWQKRVDEIVETLQAKFGGEGRA